MSEYTPEPRIDNEQGVDELLSDQHFQDLLDPSKQSAYDEETARLNALNNAPIDFTEARTKQKNALLRVIGNHMMLGATVTNPDNGTHANNSGNEE